LARFTAAGSPRHRSAASRGLTTLGHPQSKAHRWRDRGRRPQARPIGAAPIACIISDEVMVDGPSPETVW